MTVEGVERPNQLDFLVGCGEVSVQDINRRPRPLVDGEVLYLGDRIRTGQGTARLRFSDGARVEVRPRTVFEVYDYLLPVGNDAGVFGCMGNHEAYASILEAAERGGARRGRRSRR